jgi:hypothetical protein
VCEIFGYPFILPDETNYHPEKFLTLTNQHLEFLKDQSAHQRMYFFEKNEIYLTDKVRVLLLQLIGMNLSKSTTIGVMFNNVIPLMKVMGHFDENSSSNAPQDSESRENDFITSKYITRNNMNIAFSSIRSHEEKQYDIVLMGMTKEFYNSKNFKKTLYTALTRARSYIFLVGPIIRLNDRRPNHKILRKMLEKGGFDYNRRSV